MIIPLKTTKYYFLTYKNEKRKQHMLQEFKDLDITGVESVPDNSKYKSGAIGFSRILDLASFNQERNKPFQPFVIFEDDVNKYREFPESIVVPYDTDILYIGLSLCGMRQEIWCNEVCYTNVNEDIIKVHNMLALHGIVICSPRGLLAIQKAMLEGYFKDVIWDIFTAQIQPFYNVYALRKPLVYQFAELGGQEAHTKIEYNELNKEMDSSWINKKIVSNRTCFNQVENVNADVNVNANTPLNDLFRHYGNIEKKIHISWKSKNILDTNFSIVNNGVKALKNLNPDYVFEISDDDDVDNYIKRHVSKEDYELVKDRYLVEKTDLWRLLKIYHEGGVYMDIDRLCNIPLKDVIKPNVKCILPMHFDIDFSQDIMISCSNNILHKRAIELNLERRRCGWTDILSLAPITYFHAITEVLLGKQIDRYPNSDNLHKLRTMINECMYLDTYREVTPFDTLLYRGDAIAFDKQEFYDYCSVKHWVSVCGNDPLNKPGGM